METIANILQLFFSSYIVAWIMLLALVVASTWLICRKYSDIKHKTDVIDNLPCSEHQRMIHATSEDMREIKGMLTILTENIDFPFGKVNRKTERVFSRKHSPRALNEAGESLYVRSGGKAFVEANLDELVAVIDGLKPLTALDVEADSVAALRQLSTTPKMNAVKNWIYNAPMEKVTDVDGRLTDYEITLGDVLFVCSIPLRDKYLALHSEILRKGN